MSNSFFTELKRRNVLKVATGYVILGWLTLQVADVIVPILELPNWTLKLLLFIGVIGFPFAIFFAWAYELTPDGIQKESEVAPEESVAKQTGQKLNIIISVMLVISIGYIFYQKSLNTNPEVIVEAPEPDLDNEGSQQPDGTSIAVLPFVNVSADTEQEFFSDGITDEILNLLARTPNLLVTSRSSAFAFKGKNINITEVAQKLRVKNVLEGSVRSSGNRLRITAQLIDAETDKHLWSETYDTELTDIFKVQDEISTAIVNALRNKLGIPQPVVRNTNTDLDVEAYNEYLKGKFFLEKRTLSDLERSLTHFENALNINPSYALAYTGKANATILLAEDEYGNQPRESTIKQARIYADRAFKLAPDIAEVQYIMGVVEIYERNDVEHEAAKEYLRRAIDLNPNFADAYRWYARIDAAKALEFRKRAVDLDPMNITNNVVYAELLRNRQLYKQAWEVALHILDIDPDNHLVYNLMASISARQNKFAESFVYYKKGRDLNPSRGYTEHIAYRLFAIGLIDEAFELFNSNDDLSPYTLLYTNQYEQYYAQLKTIYPKDEFDVYGFGLLGRAAMFAGKYAECIEYYERQLAIEEQELNESDNWYLAHCYKLTGDTEKLEAFLVPKREFSELAKGGVRADFEYELMGDIALLEGRIDDAFTGYNKANLLDEGKFSSWYIKNSPYYKALWSHPQWPELLSLREKRSAEIRMQYITLSQLDISEVIAQHSSEDLNVVEWIDVDSEILRDYVGKFELTEDRYFEVTIENDELYFQPTGTPKTKMRAVGKDTFEPIAFKAVARFNRNNRGEVISLSIFIDSAERILPKVE